MQEMEREGLLLWDDLRTRLVPQERDEVRRLIGSRLIEENEILNREWISLRDMLEQFRNRNDEKLKKLVGSVRFVYETPTHLRLKKEIKELIERLKSDSKFTFVDHVRNTSKNDAIVTFLSSADSNQSLEAPRRRRSSSSSASSADIKRPVTPSSSIVDSLLSNTTKCTLSRRAIENVAEAVRASMKEERRVLECAIKDLNRELEEESNHLTKSIEKVKKSKPPSADELRAYKSRLSSSGSLEESSFSSGSHHDDLRKTELTPRTRRRKKASFRSRFEKNISEARYLS